MWSDVWNQLVFVFLKTHHDIWETKQSQHKKLTEVKLVQIKSNNAVQSEI